jgi:hypothetical protein
MKVKATMDQVEDGTNGGCINCGEVTEGGVEPDARNYKCESCEQNQVFGLEELAIMNELELIDDSDEDSDEDEDWDD